VHAQIPAADVAKTQEIASLRILVGRAINKIKNLRIRESIIHLSLTDLASQMWTVCAH